MADLALGYSHRKIRFYDLDRMMAPFTYDKKRISSGDQITISPQASKGALFLDGNVHAASVQLVASCEPPFTGTTWELRLNEGGTWSFLNQGHETRMLAGFGDAVGLGRPSMINGFDSTHWLLYCDLNGLRLRPCMSGSGWLAVRDGHVVLSGRTEPVGAAHYWSIAQIAPAAKPAPQPKPRKPAKPARSAPTEP